MNIVVIGGVAAGTKTAAKLMRQDRSAKVTVYTKGKDISYAGCGLPYYVGGSIETRDELIVNTPAKYTGLTGVEVKTEMEAVCVDAAAKTVTFANGEVVGYDKLVIATALSPSFPTWQALPFPACSPCAPPTMPSACVPMWTRRAAAALWWWARASSVWKSRKTCWLRA